jgi:hypothetical protein
LLQNALLIVEVLNFMLRQRGAAAIRCVQGLIVALCQ